MLGYVPDENPMATTKTDPLVAMTCIYFSIPFFLIILGLVIYDFAF